MLKLPIACLLGPADGRAQLKRWRAFDEEFALRRTRSETELVIEYTKTAGSIARLEKLVATESRCCSFVHWSVDQTGERLRLVVTGAPDALASVGRSLDAWETMA